MEPSYKRPRLSYSITAAPDEEVDELSPESRKVPIRYYQPSHHGDSASQCDLDENEDDEEDEDTELVADLELQHERALLDNKLKLRFESIFEKYGRDFSGIGDEIDLRTGKVVVNNGHLLEMTHEGDSGERLEETFEYTSSQSELDDSPFSDVDSQQQYEGYYDTIEADGSEAENVETGDEGDEHSSDMEEHSESSSNFETRDQHDLSSGGNYPSHAPTLHSFFKDRHADAASSSLEKTAVPRNERSRQIESTPTLHEDLLAKLGPELGLQIASYIDERLALKYAATDPAWRAPPLPLSTPAKRPLLKTILLPPTVDRSPSPDAARSIWKPERTGRGPGELTRFTDEDRTLILDWISCGQRQGYALWGKLWTILAKKAPHHTAHTWRGYYRHQMFPQGAVDVSRYEQTLAGSNEDQPRFITVCGTQYDIEEVLPRNGSSVWTFPNRTTFTKEDDQRIANWASQARKDGRPVYSLGTWNKLSELEPAFTGSSYLYRVKNMRRRGLLNIEPPDSNTSNLRRTQNKRDCQTRTTMFLEEDDRLIEEWACMSRQQGLRPYSITVWNSLSEKEPKYGGETYLNRFKNLRRLGRLHLFDDKKLSLANSLESPITSIPTPDVGTSESIQEPNFHAESLRHEEDGDFMIRQELDAKTSSRHLRARGPPRREPGTMSWAEVIDAVVDEDPDLYAGLIEDSGGITDSSRSSNVRNETEPTKTGRSIVFPRGALTEDFGGVAHSSRSINVRNEIEQTKTVRSIIFPRGALLDLHQTVPSPSQHQSTLFTNRTNAANMADFHDQLPQSKFSGSTIRHDPKSSRGRVFTEEDDVLIHWWASEARRKGYSLLLESDWDGLTARVPNHTAHSYMNRYIYLREKFSFGLLDGGNNTLRKPGPNNNAKSSNFSGIQDGRELPSSIPDSEISGLLSPDRTPEPTPEPMPEFHQITQASARDVTTTSLMKTADAIIDRSHTSPEANTEKPMEPSPHVILRENVEGIHSSFGGAASSSDILSPFAALDNHFSPPVQPQMPFATQQPHVLNSADHDIGSMKPTHFISFQEFGRSEEACAHCGIPLIPTSSRRSEGSFICGACYIFKYRLRKKMQKQALPVDCGLCGLSNIFGRQEQGAFVCEDCVRKKTPRRKRRNRVSVPQFLEPRKSEIAKPEPWPRPASDLPHNFHTPSLQFPTVQLSRTLNVHVVPSPHSDVRTNVTAEPPVASIPSSTQSLSSRSPSQSLRGTNQTQTERLHVRFSSPPFETGFERREFDISKGTAEAAACSSVRSTPNSIVPTSRENQGPSILRLSGEGTPRAHFSDGQDPNIHHQPITSSLAESRPTFNNNAGSSICEVKNASPRYSSASINAAIKRSIINSALQQHTPRPPLPDTERLILHRSCDKALPTPKPISRTVNRISKRLPQRTPIKLSSLIGEDQDELSILNDDFYGLARATRRIESSPAPLKSGSGWNYNDNHNTSTPTSQSRLSNSQTKQTEMRFSTSIIDLADSD